MSTKLIALLRHSDRELCYPQSRHMKTITFWQQVSQITINDGALFLAGVNDPREHEEIIQEDERAYNHFLATKLDECSLNIALIRDAIESHKIEITQKHLSRDGAIEATSKISKTSFVDWCESTGRRDIVDLLAYKEPQSTHSSPMTPEEREARMREMLKRHNELRSSGVKSPTKQIAAEYKRSKGLVRQILQAARKLAPQATPQSVATQLKSITRNSTK